MNEQKRMIHGREGLSRDEAGHVTLIVAIIAMVIMGFSLTMLATVQTATRERSAARDHLQRLYIADSGVKASVLSLSRGEPGDVGLAASPLPFSGGGFWTTVTDHGDQSFTVISRGEYQGRRRVIQALVRETGHVFHHALYAGNSSEDPGYTMEFSGTGTEADVVAGAVYSGGSVEVSGDATIDGPVRAKDDVIGVPGEAGVTQPSFDFSGIDYNALADVVVDQEFASHEFYGSDDAGGSAWQVPETSSGHIFRKNPSDRLVECFTTVKDDYFLEDPYEPLATDPAQDGSDPYRVSLVDPAGLDGVRRVYYIDGNLWVHNRFAYSLMVDSVGTKGSQITFVVRGNIYYSDNIFLDDPTLDGLAFVALIDPAEPQSGNIYFGDPIFGTLEEMNAFMYAENDFYDNALNAPGSKNVVVKGTMAAGNHVSINRNWGTSHSRLEVDFDPRIRNGQLELPGLPAQTQVLDYAVVAWMEVSPHL